jgi:isocitrate dehydrogenase
VHTYDIYKEGVSTQKVGTKEFADAVIARLGQVPQKLKPFRAGKSASNISKAGNYTRKPAKKKELVGVDVVLHFKGSNSNELAQKLQSAQVENLELSMITNRGIKVWPNPMSETFCTDHWIARFLPAKGKTTIGHDDIVKLLGQISSVGLDFVKTENLCKFEGKAAYSMSQ